MRPAEQASQGRRLLFVVTHPMTARLLMQGQLTYLHRHGFEVGVIASPGPLLEEVGQYEKARVFPIPLARRLSPARDLLALGRIVAVIRRYRPQIVNAGTPKGGLLGMLAARLTRVPVRVYTLRGLRHETMHGFRRHLQLRAERLAAASAHAVICVSPSLRKRCLELRLTTPQRTGVVGSGSSNGVDIERYRPRARAEIAILRSDLGLPPQAPVIGFVGRLTRDKGIEDLAQTYFDQVLPEYPDAHLLLLGEFEGQDPVRGSTQKLLRLHPQVVCPGFVSDTAPYYGLMDVVAFPSYREGFPNVPLEAASSAVPVVGYRATGTVDAVEEGKSGLLFALGDLSGLGRGLCTYLGCEEIRQSHGQAGRARAARLFSQETVWKAWAGEYERLVVRHLAAPHGAQARRRDADVV